MKNDDFAIVAARLALGLMSPEDLPRVAVDAMVEGLDTPSLRLLAGLNKGEAGEARQLFDCLLVELGLPKLNQREAVALLARENARAILNGRISPYKGAKRIWQLTLSIHEESMAEFDTFIYGASEWEDRPEAREVLEAGIVDAARELLSASSTS